MGSETHSARSPERAKPYLDMGVRHFCIGTDIVLIYDWMKANGEQMRKLLS